jgi:hypothetical protein
VIHVFFFAGVFLAPLIPKGRAGGGHGGHRSQILFLPTWYQVADQCSPYLRRARPWRTSVFLPFPLGTEYPTSVERFLTRMNTPDPGSSFNFFCRTCSGPTQKWNLEFSSGLGSSNKYIRILVLPHPISVRFRYSENQVQFWVTQI